MRQAAGCPVCGSSNRAFLCQDCVSTQILQAESQQLQQSLEQLRQRKAALLQRLEGHLRAKEAVQQQQLAQWHQQQQLRAAQGRAQRARDVLARARAQATSLAGHNASRRQVLEQLVAQAGQVRAEVLGHQLPTILRYQGLTLAHVAAMLEREQRLRLRQLCEVFSLRINALRTSGGPIQITLANLRLPQSGTPPPGGWPEPEAMSAALGYLLLFVDQVGMIMGGPMLHESHYQGSTSSIWQPPSFWSRQPRSPQAMLPLHVLSSASGAAGGPAGQAAYSTTTNRYLATANFWGLPRADSGGLATGAAAAASAASAAASAAAAAFSRATGFDAPGFYGSSPSSTPLPAAAAAAGGGAPAGSSSSSSSSSSNPPEPGGARGSSGASNASSSGGSGSGGGGRHGSDFKAAWDLLQRSLACFLRDKAAANGMQLPAAWNPLAWLVVYCAVVKRDARQDGKLVALSSRVDAAAAAAAAAASAAAGPGDAGGDATSGAASAGGGVPTAAQCGDAGGPTSPAYGWEDGGEEEEDEGWVVQTTFLPPPPSQPDQVEHWARAMYADGNALAGSAGGQAGGGGQAGASGAYAAAYGLPRALLVQAGAGLGRVGSGQQAAAAPGQPVALGTSPGAGGMMSMERIRLLFSK